jgi:2-oxo-4-hydroxy-4-carboxy-5-ureidoimidazoline decarboxylase
MPSDEGVRISVARISLADLNTADRHRFVALLGGVYEHSPWVAERAWAAQPFVDVDALHTALEATVAAAHHDEQLALLCAHPDLGARARMSDASTGEQAGAGLDRLPPDLYDRLLRLNTSYRERFGFPFLLAVAGRTAPAIIEALEQRLPRTPEEEFAEAMRQVARIARIRLDTIVDEA